MKTQISETTAFLKRTFGSGGYDLFSVWHTGSGFVRDVVGSEKGANTSAADVEARMRTACLVFVDGGNTYALEYFLQRDPTVTEALKSRLRAGALYVGASAGAIVAR